MKFSVLVSTALVALAVVADVNSDWVTNVLPYATLAQIRAALHAGNVTSKYLVQFYMDRIQKFDLAGPKLKSLIELNPDLPRLTSGADFKIEQCRSIAETRAQASCFESLGSLVGIPILVKDNIATKDRMATAAGSYALLDSIVPDDAEVIKKLTHAGAIIFGKAGMTEWANYRSYWFPNGWSGRGGQVISVFGPSFDPWGSSSGCGVAVAVGLVPVCIGTETLGSIVSPAKASNIIGLKPRPGSVPGDGIIPITLDEDVAGPLCRYMADCIEVYEVLLNANEIRNGTVSPVAGMRIGFIDHANWAPYPTYPSYAEQYHAALKALQDAGAEIVNVTDGFDLEAWYDWPAEIVDSHFQCRFREDLNDYLKNLKSSRIRSLKDAIDFNNAYDVAERTTELGQIIFEASQNATTYRDDPVYCANVKQEYRFNGISHPKWGYKTLMDKYNVEAVITEFFESVFQGGLANWPVIALPLGFDAPAGYPNYMEITAPSDKPLLQVGKLLEANYNTLFVPKFNV